MVDLKKAILDLLEKEGYMSSRVGFQLVRIRIEKERPIEIEVSYSGVAEKHG